MSDINNNIPTRITQLEEATEYEDGMFYAVAKAGRGTYKIPVDEMTPNEQALSDKIENEIVPAVENSFAYGTVDESEIATFTDGSPLPMPKLEIAVEPQQDLHGYDAPWVGGAGKNKLPIDSLSISGGGVTAIIDRDSNNNVVSVTVNGTASGTVYVILNTFTLPSGTYTMSGCPSNGGTDSYRLYDDKHTSWADNGSGASFTLSEASQVAPTIRIANGYTVNNLKFYPMIESGSEKTAFAPYSNICPISGWSAVDVTVADDVDNPTTTKTITIQLGDTYYGGKLDVVSGVLTVDRIFGEFDGVDEDWGNTGAGNVGNRSNVLFNAFPSTDIDTNFVAICNTYEGRSYDDRTFNRINVVWVNPNGSLTVVTDSDIDTAEKFKALLQNTPLQVIAKLATPLTIQLSPTQVNSLLGVNNIFANTGKINKAVYIRDLDIVINSLLERIAALEG